MVKNKTRILARKGKKNYCLKLEEVVLFVSEQKIAFAFDTANEKYLCNGNLSEVASFLDSRFYRANRQYIINIEHLKTFETFERVKLQVEMELPNNNHQIIVSQENCKRFRKWVASQ